MNTTTPSTPRDNIIPELLQAARHERVLLAELDAARAEAESMLDQAAIEALRIHADAAYALDQELASREKQAAEQRALLHDAILAIAENKARREVDQARQGAENILNDILGLIVPAGMNRHD